MNSNKCELTGLTCLRCLYRLYHKFEIRTSFQFIFTIMLLLLDALQKNSVNKKTVSERLLCRDFIEWCKKISSAIPISQQEHQPYFT